MATSGPGTRRSEAVERFKVANRTLQELLSKGTRQKLRAFPDLADADVLSASQKLESALASFTVTRNTSATAPSRLDTAKKIAKEWFLASYPFAQVILQIGTTSSQIPILNPYGLLFGGLLVLGEIAYKETKRAKEIDESMVILSAAIGRIQLTSEFPKNIPTTHIENTQCAAIDLCTSILNYVAIAIKISNKLVIKNIISTLFRGSSELDAALKRVNVCIAEYSTAIIDLGVSLNIQLITYSQGIQTSLAELTDRFGKFLDADTRRNLHPQTNDSKVPDPPKKLYRIPFEQNPKFEGRTEVLQNMRDQLSRSEQGRYNHRLALYGLGGIGKTQVALEYAYRHRDARAGYDYIVWLHAAERAGLIQGLASVGRETGSATRQDELTVAAEETVQWLGRQPKCLVIYDNLDDPHTIRGLLPSNENGCHVLITTRNGDVKRIPSEGLEVNELSESEALRFLRGTSHPSAAVDSEGQKEVVRALGMLPLAIDLARVFVKDWGCKTFLECLRNSGTDFIRETPEGNHAYPMSLYTTWSLSLERLEQASIVLVEVFAFLNPDNISLNFLAAGPDPLHPQIPPLNGFKFKIAIGELRNLSLIKLHHSDLRKISMHRLVQSVIRDRLTPSAHYNRLQTAVEIGNVSFQFSLDELDRKTRISCREMLPQVLGLFSYCTPDTYDIFANAAVSDAVPAFLYEEFQISECISVNMKIYEARKYSFGLEDRRTLSTLRGLAIAKTRGSDERQFEDGIKIFEEVVAAQTRLFGPDNLDTLWTKNGLGASYLSSGRWEEGTEMLEETYAARRRILGEDNVHTLRTKYNLARGFSLTGRVDEAIVLNEECLEQAFKVLGKSHWDTYKIMHSLGVKYDQKGGSEKAQVLYREAEAGQDELFGELADKEGDLGCESSNRNLRAKTNHLFFSHGFGGPSFRYC